MPDVEIDPSILRTVAQMVRRARTEPHMELETRLGVMREGRFDARIPRSHMDALLPALAEFAKASPERLEDRCGEWLEEDSFYFRVGARQVRTRIAPSEGGSATTVEKRAVDTVLLRTLTFDVKVCLSEEIPVRAADLPNVADTHHVRAKQVRTFRCPGASLDISCAAVWSGATQTEVERAQAASEPFFELECELDVAGLTRERTDEYLAESLLLKTANLMMTPGQRFECVPQASNSACRKRARAK